MDDFSERLEQLLSDPQALSRLGELAAGLGLGQPPPPPPPAGPPAPRAPGPAGPGRGPAAGPRGGGGGGPPGGGALSPAAPLCLWAVVRIRRRPSRR